MKKRMLALSLIIAVCMGFSACSEDKQQLSAEKTMLKLNVGKSHTIELDQGDVDGIEWSSDDVAVAAVSADGTVTGKSDGITVVTGKTEDSYIHFGVIVEGNESYKDDDGNVVKIYDGKSDITAITVGVKAGGKNDVTIAKGSTYTLQAYTTPENSKDKIDWKSENPSVVHVDENGVIKAVGKGKTIVKATAPNGVYGEMIIRVN